MNPTLSPDPADSALLARIHQEIAQAGGWLPFDRFMALALYTPGLGYYAHTGRKFGHMPTSGSDFVTAPELSPAFGRALARQVAQALAHSGTHTVWEFGPGSGALARQLLEALGDRVRNTCWWTSPAACARVSAKPSRPMPIACAGWTPCPSA